MKAARKYTLSEVSRRLLAETRPNWLQIAALFGISLITIPLTLLTPIPLKLMIDSIIGTEAFPQVMEAVLPAGADRTSFAAIALVAGFFVLIALGKQLCDLGFSVLRTYTGEKLVLGFRAKLFRHVQRLSLSYHDSKGTADSTYRIQYDAPAIQWISIDAIIPLVTALFTLLAMIFVMARIDWQLAGVALLVAPFLFVVSQRFSRLLKLRWREAKDLESSTLGVVQEVLSSVRVVKAFVQEDREQKRYVEHAGRNLKEQLRLSVTAGTFSLIIGMAMAFGTAAVLFIGTRHVQSGQLTLGEFILVMSYLAMLYSPLQTLSKSAGSLQGSLVSLERAFEILDQAEDVPEKPNAKPLARARGEVRLENVFFAYTPDRPALRGISFEVPAGARVGIAGTTGAGKSTLVGLLLRLYDPGSGRIFLDGVDLRDYKRRDLRNQFAIVLQEPVLFSSSIAENIAYAKPLATEDEIIAAAEAANARDFITRLPHGYKTLVGERGVQLSGGERQRISLARAFLKDAPILILDEPTSSVDVKTEAAILDAMERLMRGRTTFMIAHRLSTLDICNLRLRLELGRLVSVTNTANPEKGLPAILSVEKTA
jgi:ATP-binding cassette, subfamily B, bacterial